MYSENSCYTQIVTPDDPKLKKHGVLIDEKAGIWTYRLYPDQEEGMPSKQIGEHRVFDRGCRYGVIGVFNCTNLKHLNALLSASKEATDDTSPFDVD